MKIERTIFWFEDGNEMLSNLNDAFYGLSMLMNRLLNESYEGKKLKFINIYFSTESSYEANPHLPKNEPYYYGGDLQFYGFFDKDSFLELSFEEQKKFIWKSASQYLVKSGEIIKNNELKKSAEFAFNKGVEINLNTDLKLIEKELAISNEKYTVSIWITFQKEYMYSSLLIEKKSGKVFEKVIDKTRNGVEFFLDIYKDILSENGDIIIRGSKDVDYLPLRISLNSFNK